MDFVEILKKHGYKVTDLRDVKGGVDIIAVKDGKVFVLKVLSSLEAFKPHHAEDMVKLSSILNGIPILIAERYRYGTLEKGVVYYRHGIPVISAETFSDMMSGRLPVFIFIKGKKIAFIDSEKLRTLREEKGISQWELAKNVGVTKEMIYRYERGGSASAEVLERIENFLGEPVHRPVDLEKRFDIKEELKYPFTLLANKGAEVFMFKSTPWEAVGKRNITISFVLKDHLTKNRLRVLERIRGNVFSYMLVIGKHRKLPYIEEEEIIYADSFKEIEKIAKERSGQ